MQTLRAAKVAGIADDIPPLEVFGPEQGDLLILGWGSTYGAIRSAVERLTGEGKSVAHAHLRHLNPFPANTEAVLRSYRRVLIPEVNLGQLLMLIRARYLIDAVGYDQVRGKPFRIAEIVDEAERILAEPHVMTDTNGHAAAAARPAAAQRGERGRHPADPQGLRVRPGGPLVPGLRRLLDPGPDPEGDARLRVRPREHRVRLGDRLLRPAAVLHEHLRLPHDPRPRADARDRAQGGPART